MIGYFLSLDKGKTLLLDFAFAYIFSALTWSVVAFVVYLVATEVIFILAGNSSRWTLPERVASMTLKFYGWALGRASFGDQWPLRRAEEFSEEDEPHRPEYPGLLAEAKFW